MSSTVDPLKLLNRGPAYLRNAFQTQATRVPSLSAAERLNVRKKSSKSDEEKKQRPATAPVKELQSIKRSEFETWTAEQLVNRGSEIKQNPGYAARMLAAGSHSRPNSAKPYPIQRRRQAVRGNHKLIPGKQRERSNSVDRFFDTLGGTCVSNSNPSSLVRSGSISDLSGLSRAASQNIRSRSSTSSLHDKLYNHSDVIKKSKPEVSQVEKRIRVMMWLSNCKPQHQQFSNPVKG